MRIPVHFYSYYQDLTGCAQTSIPVAEPISLRALLIDLARQFPQWAPMENATLIAVGVEYQNRDYILKAGDEVSLFPPVQGG